MSAPPPPPSPPALSSRESPLYPSRLRGLEARQGFGTLSGVLELSTQFNVRKLLGGLNLSN